MKTDYEDVWDWRVENDNKPLWTRAPREVAEADYNEFFKQVRQRGRLRQTGI
jgi:heat shock protein beta